MQPFDSKHFLTGEELSQKELLSLLDLATSLKKSRGTERTSVLNGKTVALIFEKPSLRTRLSFTVGVQELGGSVVELTGSNKKNEEPEDAIRVLQGMVHGVMLRTFEHSILERMVSKAKIPVINGLSDSHHPCQALADLQTLKERFGKLKGLTVAYIGDGNNILHSTLLLFPFLGVNVNYACPENYQPDAEILKRAIARAEIGGAIIQKCATPSQAVQKVDALYTDVWTSMGFEAENKQRMQAFEGYQINKALLQKAQPSAIVLHCLPMIKGQEITEDVVESPQSAIFDQAENRLHAQKALMMGIYGG
jgi:ornithine carbamoyltransferase